MHTSLCYPTLRCESSDARHFDAPASFGIDELGSSHSDSGSDDSYHPYFTYLHEKVQTEESDMKNVKLLILITALVFIFLIGPFIMIFLTSFSSDAIMRFPPKGFTLSWYTKALNIEMFRTTFWVSLKTGLMATATAMLLGVPVAYANIRFNNRGKGILELLFSSPAIVPGMVIDSLFCVSLYTFQTLRS